MNDFSQFSKTAPEQDEDIVLLTESAAPRLKHIGVFHWRGFMALFFKEIVRFLKIPIQTIFSPLLMTLLFFAVFSVSLKPHAQIVENVPYLDFLLPGLLIMAMAQSAFFNTSSSLILSKLQGNIVDVLMAPLSPFELTLAYALSGVVRGFLVGFVTLAALAFFYPFSLAHPFFVLLFAFLGVLMLSLLGLITGLLGDSFDHLGAVQNLLIMPATFLSGSFFSLRALPEAWTPAYTFNPFFYMIDGFRYGFINLADASVWVGVVFLLLLNSLLFALAYWLFSKSPRLKP